MRRRIAVAAGVAALAVAGGGAAIAASGIGSPQEESKAIIDDAAEELGVESSELSTALKNALKNRVDAAVAAGRLTQAQGNELKARIDAEEYPLLGGFGHHGPGGHGFRHFAAAAEFLGLTEAELRTQLESGKTMAQVAQAQGKTVAGLVAALVADEKKELDEAVAAGRITQAQADEKLAGAEERFTDMVNGVMPERGFRDFGGPPPSSEPANAAYSGSPI
jgi:hypothetical protein